MAEQVVPSIDEFLGRKQPTIADHIRKVADAIGSAGSQPHLPPIDSPERSPAERALVTVYQHNAYTDVYQIQLHDISSVREWRQRYDGICKWAGYMKNAAEVVRKIQKGNPPRNSRERELYRSRHLNGALVMGGKIAVYDRLNQFGELAATLGVSFEFSPFEQLNLFDLAGETVFKRRGFNIQTLRNVSNQDIPVHLRAFQFIADCLLAYSMENYDPFTEENRNNITDKFPVLTREKIRTMCNLLINTINVPSDDLMRFGNSFRLLDKHAAEEAGRIKERVSAASTTIFQVLLSPDSPLFSGVKALFEPRMDNPFVLKLLFLPIIGLQGHDRVRALYKVSEDYARLGVFPEFYVRISQCMADIAHTEGRKRGMFTIRDLPFLYNSDHEPDMNRIPIARELQHATEQITQLSAAREHRLLDPTRIAWGGIKPPHQVEVIFPESGKVALQLSYPDGEDLTMFQFQMDFQKKENQWWFLETPSHNVDLDKLYIHLQVVSKEVLTALHQQLVEAAVKRDAQRAAALAPHAKGHIPRPNIRIAKVNSENGNVQDGGTESGSTTAGRNAPPEVVSPRPYYRILRPPAELLKRIPKKFRRQIYTAIDERNNGIDRGFKAMGTMRDVCVFEIKSGKYRIILVPQEGTGVLGPQDLRVFDVVLRNEMDSDKFMNTIYERIKREQA